MADFEFDVEPLRSLAQAGASAARGLPPDDVRKLGARRRKRRLTVTAGVAAVMATALAGGAAAVVDQFAAGRNLEPGGPAPLTEVTTAVTATPPPTPGPSGRPFGDPLPGRVIPADFPIDADMPDYGEDGQIEAPELAYWYREISPCAAEFLPAQIEAALVDAISVRLTAPEVEVFRGLWVFENAGDAESVLQAYVDDDVRACPRDMADATATNFTVDKADFGDESFVTAQSWSGRDGVRSSGLIQSALIRLGPAVLIVSEYGEAMPGNESELLRAAVLDAAETLTAATCELIQGC